MLAPVRRLAPRCGPAWLLSVVPPGRAVFGGAGRNGGQASRGEEAMALLAHHRASHERGHGARRARSSLWQPRPTRASLESGPWERTNSALKVPRALSSVSLYHRAVALPSLGE
jgi:hypothetical protein